MVCKTGKRLLYLLALKTIILTAAFFLPTPCIQSQELAIGGGFLGYKQQLDYFPTIYYTTKLDNTVMYGYSPSVSVGFMYKRFITEVLYSEYRLHLLYNGIVSSGIAGHGGGSSEQSEVHYNGYLHNRSIFFSVGAVIFPTKKINIIPMIGLGAERNFGQKASMDYAVTDGSWWSYYPGPPIPGGSPDHGTYHEERKASEIMYVVTRHTVIKTAGLKFRCRFSKNLSIDLHGGVKFNNQPIFEIGYYREGMEWFAGAMFNYAFAFRLRNKTKTE
jgi:hypothetical protein